MARIIAANLDTKIQGTSQLHFGLAQAHDLAVSDKAKCSAFLADVLAKNPQFTGILTINPDGKLFCDSLQTGRVLDLRDRYYFKRALETTNAVIVEPVFGRLTGAPVLQIAYPARDELGQLRFVLLASLDLARFMAAQAKNLPDGVDVVLADSEGRVLGRSSPQPRGVGQGHTLANSGLLRFATETDGETRELVNANGEGEVWAVAHALQVGSGSLHVLAGRSKSELVAAPNQRLAKEIAILVALLLLFLSGIWLLAELSIRFQIGRIAAMAERLGAGDLGVRIPPPFPRGELGKLMSVLNGTAASLEAQRQAIEDLNQKLRCAQELEAQERERLDYAVSNIVQGLLLFDSTERLAVVNQRYIEMFGLSPDIVKPGCSFRELIAHRKAVGSLKGDVDEHCESIRYKVSLGKVSRINLEAADGRLIQVLNQPLPGGGWMTTMEDITQRKADEERIIHMAHYDALTDLPNRTLFSERLDLALQLMKPDEQLAVHYIDIDQFKSINDSLGHPIGDELLKAVASRLRGCLGTADFAARIGGDEFAIIQTGVREPSDTTDLVGRIYRTIREPYECNGHQVTTDASIGIAVAPRDGGDIDQLLKNADLAMYAAKADGRRTYRFFEASMEECAKAHRALEMDLRLAIAGRDLEIYYQPLVNLQSNEVNSCEALLRWRHPERGMISPADFIPVAEETGLINPLGEWVLTTACAEAVTWPDDIKLAVNVSPVQFRSQAFALKVAAALAASGLPPRRLELEITEAVLIHDDEAALEMLHQLRGLGVGIALDDFGTGYSSLSYLQRFPFDKIKIDRSFIKDISGAGESSCIVQAVVNIAASRNMTTTAEGVETEQQRIELRRLGCTEMQGYLFSPAIPAADIAKLFSRRDRRTAGAA
ncbi:MAG: EAL domain-containing protein [Rhodopseudomonas sp.]|nr:EAL domain-containing protein [Rhodopseudomonas sp.]